MPGLSGGGLLHHPGEAGNAHRLLPSDGHLHPVCQVGIGASSRLPIKKRVPCKGRLWAMHFPSLRDCHLQRGKRWHQLHCLPPLEEEHSVRSCFRERINQQIRRAACAARFFLGSMVSCACCAQPLFAFLPGFAIMTDTKQTVSAFVGKGLSGGEVGTQTTFFQKGWEHRGMGPESRDEEGRR